MDDQCSKAEEELQTALRDARNELRDAAATLTSIEADFEQDTWTFRLHEQAVSAGGFIVISAVSWERIWEHHIYRERPALSASPEHSND